MQNLFIRFAGQKEAEMIAELSRKTFYETFAPYNSKENMEKFMKESFSKEVLVKQVSTPGNTFFIAFAGNEPVGHVRMVESENPQGLENVSVIEIARIYAVKSVIGKGVGKAMMNKCIEVAKEKNKDWIWLGVWEENRRAIEFYKKCGFKKFGEHIFMLGDDAQTDWLMKKEL